MTVTVRTHERTESPCQRATRSVMYCGIGNMSRTVSTDVRLSSRQEVEPMQLAAYLHQHLAPHGHDEPIVYTDVLAEQVADVCIHWLEHDDDGQAMRQGAVR